MKTIVRALIRRKNRYLLVQRAEITGFHQWQLPGGHTDRQKPKNALIRELKEETNLNMLSAKKHSEFFNPITKKRTIIYNAKVKNPNEIKLQKSELSGFGWFTKKGMKGLNLTHSTRKVI